MTDKELVLKATEALALSYSPYSEYKVGAALLCENDNVYTGCNIENVSYSATVCAERTAIFKAISEGEQKFISIAIAASKEGTISEKFLPCGICRQVLNEFCCGDLKIMIAKNNNGDFLEYTLSELLPNSFDKDALL